MFSVFIMVVTQLYPPGNEHIPSKGNFEDDFPFPVVGNVSLPWRVCAICWHRGRRICPQAIIFVGL